MDGNINTGIEEVRPPEPGNNKTGGVLSNLAALFAKVSDKVPPKVKEAFGKFYANKKIFVPVTVAFGLLFLVLIAGLLFGSKSPTVITNPTPAPFVQSTPESSPSGDILSVTERQLKDLNNQINSLDINQGRLQPPEINYKVSF